MTTVCSLNVFLHSDNLYGPYFAFVMECDLIKQIWRRLCLLNGGMYQAFVHIDQWNGV